MRRRALLPIVMVVDNSCLFPGRTEADASQLWTKLAGAPHPPSSYSHCGRHGGREEGSRRLRCRGHAPAPGEGADGLFAFRGHNLAREVQPERFPQHISDLGKRRGHKTQGDVPLTKEVSTLGGEDVVVPLPRELHGLHDFEVGTSSSSFLRTLCCFLTTNTPL